MVSSLLEIPKKVLRVRLSRRRYYLSDGIGSGFVSPMVFPSALLFR